MNKNTKGKIMNIRRILTIGLLVSYLGSHTLSSAATLNGISLQMHPSNWHAVKDIFIDEPQRIGSRSIWPMAPAAVGAVAAAYGAWKKFDRGLGIVNSIIWPVRHEFRNVKVKEKSNGEIKEKVDYKDFVMIKPEIKNPLLKYAAALGALVVGWKGVHWLCRYRSVKAAERKQMELVMESWKQLRSDFPEELQPALETLYQLKVQNSPDYAANVDRTIRFVQESVCKHFSKPLLTHMVHALNKIEVQDSH